MTFKYINLCLYSILKGFPDLCSGILTIIQHLLCTIEVSSFSISIISLSVFVLSACLLSLALGTERERDDEPQQQASQHHQHHSTTSTSSSTNSSSGHIHRTVEIFIRVLDALRKLLCVTRSVCWLFRRRRRRQRQRRRLRCEAPSRRSKMLTSAI